jgi:hypothetical protein
LIHHYDIQCLVEYIKGQGWFKQCDISVNLKEKDEEFLVLKKWFEEKLNFR